MLGGCCPREFSGPPGAAAAAAGMPPGQQPPSISHPPSHPQLPTIPPPPPAVAPSSSSSSSPFRPKSMSPDHQQRHLYGGNSSSGIRGSNPETSGTNLDDDVAVEQCSDNEEELSGSSPMRTGLPISQQPGGGNPAESGSSKQNGKPGKDSGSKESGGGGGKKKEKEKVKIMKAKCNCEELRYVD